MNEDDRGFIYCECGKRIIRRDIATGAIVFKFGSIPKGHRSSVVEMHIKGTIRMRCLDRRCNIISEIKSINPDIKEEK